MANILNVPYFPQTDEGGCLPACVQMVLAYLGEIRSQAVLARQLGTRSYLGTPHRNINRLQSHKIDVRYAAEGTANTIRAHLTQNVPVIVFVQTSELPYWQGHISRHALVVIGEIAESVYLLDPAMSVNPLTVSWGDFLLAWDEMDATYAVLQRAK